MQQLQNQIILNTKRQWQKIDMGKQQIWNLLNFKSTIKSINKVPQNMMHSTPVIFNLKNKCQDMRNFPVLEGEIPSFCRHIFEGNMKNSETCIQRYSELSEKISKSRTKSAILIHTQRTKKLLVHERLKLLLDDESFLELSPLAGLNMPYGDVPAGGCITGIGRISGIWCSFMANDSSIKGGTIYPVTLKKILRCQEIAIKNKLPFVYIVDSGGAFLPLQAELFADKFHGGRMFYNQAVMSALKIPQVSVVCGSCTAGGAYTPVMSEETSIVDKIGTVFLGGPPLVKAATGEDTNPEELGGASLHAKVSGCVDHFASSEKEAFEYIKNAISTLNYVIPIEEIPEFDNPLYGDDDLLGLAPQDYSYTLHIKLILSRIIDGSRFQEFKANYGITLVTGFAYIEGELIGIVANNGELTHNASLKGCHFIQLCSQRNIPILFLMNTVPCTAEATNPIQAEDQANRLKAQASMMAAVACASVPKITFVIGGCLGSESYAMCGRSFDPNFLFLWPNARIALVDSRRSFTFKQLWNNNNSEPEIDLKVLKEKLQKESNALYSSARIWDDGVILPQNSRKVIGLCLRIMKQQRYRIVSMQQSSFPIMRM
ncbi:methylcrotonoyl-CoA carboxylase beta chain, mitochondrial-like isoform X3 [Thamnophis elegans]|uniref:methylcrotonoyl-CoA carboxylase beta chain, mitochondrial-like isoform X2 n=1 Tax=Thamnophis elegans TaxID=35005 RepID=UPI0013771CB7|nr:methylcrotonoyl-CoA carboxylase beta chain, mitochondrial-like isoform X2 [Thamnophis elegans]XP_032073679.1 methylcrotonoyl-CoA carboxylase beta chain, mitochondrial-like isoform X2 [Thamnophis elegans]XP_032073680.1 methylcrotonoyl-CoA carboxylase beta chain, mitochondrial-like isoform X2 [Thamnophis elegans]XP_032073681.1 methylcrotonoyl-CoA carboxylase beta chain, mitochondrial-like isoform X3 [Thamnophis elegans]